MSVFKARTKSRHGITANAENDSLFGPTKTIVKYKLMCNMIRRSEIIPVGSNLKCPATRATRVLMINHQENNYDTGKKQMNHGNYCEV